jgi:hypothetical protein
MRANAAKAVTGYTLRVVNGVTWRIYNHDKKQSNGAAEMAAEMVEQYYFHEDVSNVRKLVPGQGIQKSFPRHHCLMKASLSSTQTLIHDKCLYRSYTRTAYAFQPECIISSRDALARIHAVKETPFTEFTAHQKKYLMAQSAMAGLLVSRLFGFSSAKPHTIKWLKKHADITAKYIHSALACEYLIGNRYYYNLPAVLRQEMFPIGRLPIEKRLVNIKAEDATYDKILQSQKQLLELYNSNIERLEDAVKQFRRGFLSIQTIREDSEYKKMLEMFWLLQTQCMKYRSVSESCMSARQTFCERNNITFDRRSIQVMVCNIVFSCQVIYPRLFAYDIAHLFDNCGESYATYIKTTKAKHLEMCNQGLISAFLTFSAIEPNMVSTALAPHMEECKMHYPSEFSEYAFHIPSRDATFGPLLSKHRVHIPRPVNITRTFFMTRNNKDCFYLPLQEALTELRTGKKVAKQVWKKNKQNFTTKQNINYQHLATPYSKTLY